MISGKHTVKQLAILGGEPAFDSPLHVGRPNIGRREQFFDYVNDIFDRKWLSNNGHYVKLLEQKLASRLDVKHCLLINSGTIALEIAIRALNLTGEVIVPAFTFVATAHALQWLGLTPVFCDIDPQTHNLDPACVEALITPRTTAILGVHLWGQPCDVATLQHIADRHNLALFFDAAHAFACCYEGVPIGRFGDLEVFSFHATKFFNTLEGGAITTNDDAVAERVRLMRNFGFAGQDLVTSTGTNGKLNEVSAAMGLTLLEDVDVLLDKNRANYAHFTRQINAIAGIQLLRSINPQQNNCQYIVTEVDGTILERDRVLAALRAENVLARRYFYPGVHRMEPYRSTTLPDSWHLPVTESVAAQCLILPGGASLNSAEIGTICDLLQHIMDSADTIRATI